MDEHPPLTSALLPLPREEALKPGAGEIALELPALIVQAGPKGMKRFLEFFTVNIGYFCPTPKNVYLAERHLALSL